ncbi:MAG: TIGR03435 family protein [Vicinamibacterales bacterium]
MAPLTRCAAILILTISQAAPEFEVASVKPNESGDRRVSIEVSPGGRFRATNAPLRSLIRIAYQLQDVQLAGGPKWLDDERFDIVAKGDGSPAPDQIRLMLQSLLAERFKLTLRRETRDLPLYALVMARKDGRWGPKLRRADADCTQAASRLDGLAPPGPPDPAAPCGYVGPDPGGGIRFRGVSVQAIAKFLATPVHRPVLDRTGLSGYFDVDLELTTELGPPPPPPGLPDRFDRSSAPSIFTALPEQLGLKLDSQRGPVDVFVIDRAEHPVEH